MKKIFALVLAMMLVLGMVSALAENGTISITPPSGVPSNASNSYPIYKVFDAVYSTSGISYSVMSGKSGVPDVSAQMTSGYDATTVNHFILDSAGNVHYGTEAADGTITDAESSAGLSEAAIKAIAAYVNGDSPVATATSTGSAAATASIPQDGFYYITTSTGTAVTITSFRPHAEVIDKNEVPTPNKIITSVEDDAGDIDDAGKEALAQVGKKVYYRVDFQIKTGAKGYEFHDYMETGLSYNNDVAVALGDSVSEATAVATNANTWQSVTADTGETIKVNFADAWVKANEGKYIVVTYSATVTSDALQTDPLTNTVYIKYGENHGYKSSEDHTDVYNAKVKVIKVDGDGEPLAGAGFILKDNATDLYFIQGTNSISWGAEANATIKTTAVTNNEAYVDFAGLPDGEYTIIEKVVPSGYNKAPDQTVTINGVDATPRTLTVEATVTNQQGAELPHTGGIGTTIFYIAGSILVLAAAILLITKRRMGNND